MEIAAAFTRPALEPYAQLEAAVRRAQELRFVKPEHLVEQSDAGNSRLAHSDRTDRIGLDQGDAGGGGQEPRQRRRRHPSGGATADDHDLSGDTVRGRAGVHAASHIRDSRAGYGGTGAGNLYQKR